MNACGSLLSFGRWHLKYLLAESTDYYNGPRLSMVRENQPPLRENPEDVETLKLEQITVRRHAGGLVSSFERKAA